jgi:hypothetical protein
MPKPIKKKPSRPVTASKVKRKVPAIEAAIPQRKGPSKEDILSALKVLSQISDDHQTASEWWQELELEKRDAQLLGRKCEKISIISGTTKSESTTEDLDQHFVYRVGTQIIMILTPVHIFSGSNLRRRTIAFLRPLGEIMPWIYAVSGKNINVTAANVLDSEIWTEAVYEFGNFHHVKDFPTDGWDVVHNRRKGISFACHAEVKLMLAYACGIYMKYSPNGAKLSVRKQIGQLWTLRKILQSKNKLPLKVEIKIDREPCKSCEAIKKLLEDMSGIHFIITVVLNLGQLKLTRNEGKGKGWYWPNVAEDELSCDEESSDSDEEELDLSPTPRQRKIPSKRVYCDEVGYDDGIDELQLVTPSEVAPSRPQVVIPMRPAMPIPVVKTKSKTKHRTGRKRKWTEDDEDLDRTYEPVASMHGSSNPKQTPRKTPRTGLISPIYTPPFHQIEEDFEETHITKKTVRLVERDMSPSARAQIRKFSYCTL